MNDYINEIEALDEKDVTPKKLLKFAKWILVVVSFIFIFGCISELIIPNNKVFEICKTTLPSFSMLIIGFYFGKNK